MGIKSRLSIAILGIAAIAIALIGGLGLLTLRSVISSTEAELASSARAEFFRAVDREAFAHEALARTLSESPGVWERMRADDRPGLLGDIASMFAALKAHGINNIHFHRPNTTTLLRLHAPNQYDDDLSTLRPMIVDVNRTGMSRRGIEMGVNGLPIRGAVPVVARDGQYLGVVEVGSFITEEFLRSFVEPGSAYTLFFLKEGRLDVFAATPGAGAPRLSAEMLAEALRHGDTKLRSQAGDKSYLSTATTLRDYAGRTVGVVQIDVDTTRLESAYSAAIQRLLAGVLFLGFVAAVTAVLTALGILRPMAQLIQTTERIAANVPAPPVPFVHRADELGRFARAISEFRASKSQLQRQAADLD